MGQGQPGEQGDTGPKGDTGNPGVGIQFVTWNSTTGEMLITKTDGSVNPPLKIQGIQGPMGPPGDYTPEEIGNVIKGDTVFIGKLASNLGARSDLATNLGNVLSTDNTFKTGAYNTIVGNTGFRGYVTGQLALNSTFVEGVSESLRPTISALNVNDIVSPKTIWCNDNLCSLPTTGTLNIPTGYSSDGAATSGQPIQFSSKANGGFKHFIRTRHKNEVNSSGNAFDFYVNNSTDAQGSTRPETGNKRVMSVNGTGVEINGNTTITSGSLIVNGRNILEELDALNNKTQDWERSEVNGLILRNPKNKLYGIGFNWPNTTPLLQIINYGAKEGSYWSRGIAAEIDGGIKTPNLTTNNFTLQNPNNASRSVVKYPDDKNEEGLTWYHYGLRVGSNNNFDPNAGMNAEWSRGVLDWRR